MGANNGTSTINFPSANVGRFMSGQTQEQIVSNLLRSEMTSGFAKQAKRSTKMRVNRSVTYLMSTGEFDYFKDWHENTAMDGALMFNYTDPMTANNDIVDARIVEGVYQATPLNPRAHYLTVNFLMELYR